MADVFPDSQNSVKLKKDPFFIFEFDRTWLAGVIIFLFIVGSAFRFYNLGKESLWYDETYTWWCITKPWIEMFNTLRNPGAEVPLFYIIVKLTSLTFHGFAEWILRLPSSLAGIAGVIIAMMIGYLSGNKAGLFAAGWFWTFHPITIWYSRDVKTYSLTAFLAGCLILIYLLLLKKECKSLWVLTGVILSLGMLSHYFFFVLAGSLILIALFSLHDRPLFFRRWVLVSFISFIPVTLWVIWFMSHPSPTLGSGWIAKPDWNDPIETFWNLVSGYAGQNSVHNTLFGLIVLLFFLFGFISRDERVPSIKIFIFGLCIPIAGIWAISQSRPLYVDRYFIILLPFLTVIIAKGAERLVFKLVTTVQSIETLHWLTFLGITILCVLGFVVAFNTLSAHKYKRESWRALYADLSADKSLTNKLWLSDPFLILPLKYYFADDYQQIDSTNPPECKELCWWILRQNFTYTHAFTQSINPSKRPWIPTIPDGCNLIKQNDYHTGIMLWLVTCP